MSSDEPPRQPDRSPEPSTPNSPEGVSPDAGWHGWAARRAARKAARKTARARLGWRRALPTWRVVVGGLLIGLLALFGAFAVGYLLVDIPSANAAATAQNNVFLYSDGHTPIASSGEINRENVTLGQVPETAQRAVLAAEDRDFYHESAIDPRAMVRAGWNTVSGKGKQSGSTITQQYVKNYYLNQEQTVGRKVEEFFIAVKLDHEESKGQILEGYLNTSYFGRNAYGIQAAAQAYYHEDADRLDTAQGAYLASLLNAPSAYDVVANPQNKQYATDRWNYVLDGMVKEHWLDPAARQHMAFPEPDPIKTPPGLSGQRGYLVEAVTDYLLDHHVLDEDRLDAGGYRITTTIQKPRQDAFAAAARGQLLGRLDHSDATNRYLRVGGASVDPATGDVVALYGGIDFTKQYVNNATRRDYQVGSTFKPFVFASAVQNHSETQDGRRITPQTVYDGTNHRRVQGPKGPVKYAPANEDDKTYGNITVSTATNKSVNAVYAQMAEDVGPAKVKATAVALGLPANTPSLSAYPSIALGVATASPLDMAQGYATLDNHGTYLPYTLVTRIVHDGRSLPLPPRPTKRAVSRQAADTTTSMLRDVVDASDGTGTAARAADRPAAGKTGTAEDDKAAWFAGYTPDLVTVVAVMGQNSDTGTQEPLYGATGLARVNGGGYPAQIWAAYTSAALHGRPARDFDLTTQRGTPGEPSTAPASAAPPTGPPGGGTSPSAPPSTPPTSPPPVNPSGGGDDGGLIGGLGDNGGTDAGTDGGAGGSSSGGSGDGGGTTGGTDGDSGGAGGGSGGPPGNDGG